MTDSEKTGIDGKMQHTWKVMLDFKGMVMVNETAQIKDGAPISILEMLKMHAALIEFVHRRVIQLLEKHASNQEDFDTGLGEFHRFVLEACSRVDDVELVKLLKARDTTDTSDPLSGLAGVVEAARAYIEKSQDFSESSTTVKEYKALRLALNNVGLET